MTLRIGEADWKVYRPLHAVALERICERVLAEVGELAGDAKQSAHERYLAIYERIQRRNREMAETFDECKRSTAWMKLAVLCRYDLVTDEELARFSAETRAVLQLYLGAE